MSKENKIEVAKIDIKIGEKVISLKPEQAKELKKILNEMFEESHDHHHWYWHYQPIYSQPYIAPNPHPWWGIHYCGQSQQLSGNIGVGQSNLQGSNALGAQTVCLALNAA